MRLTLSELASRMGGALVGQDGLVTGFATDNRQVQPGDLFICIQGEKVDGHAFALAARQAGAVGALASQAVEVPHILVSDVAEALGNLARSYRAAFAGPVIGITGSNGKTTTKELTAAAVAGLGPVLKTLGNRNAEYTAPLAWVGLLPSHRVAVVELAMRGLGQIAHLARFHQPTIGVITCIGTAHIEKVGSRAGIARAKGELLESLPAGGVSILWQEDDFFHDLLARVPGELRTFGFGPDAECQVLGVRMDGWERSIVRGSLDGVVFESPIPLIGRHQALNAAAAILAAHTAGVPVLAAAESLQQAELPPMRMEVVDVRGAKLIVDAYNASPNSTVAALHTLLESPARRRFAVLGEMRELGDFSESGHKEVGLALAGTPIDGVLTTGGQASLIADTAVEHGFPPEHLTKLDALDHAAITAFLERLGEGDVALIKGSRALELERAIEPLRRGA